MTLRYEESQAGLVVIVEDDGVGIPSSDKKKIFERGFGDRHGLGFLLVREVLSITGIAIQETGVAGEESRFEMLVPNGHTGSMHISGVTERDKRISLQTLKRPINPVVHLSLSVKPVRIHP